MDMNSGCVARIQSSAAKGCRSFSISYYLVGIVQVSGDSEGLLYIGSLSDKALGSKVKTGAGGKFLSRAPS